MPASVCPVQHAHEIDRLRLQTSSQSGIRQGLTQLLPSARSKPRKLDLPKDDKILKVMVVGLRGMKSSTVSANCVAGQMEPRAAVGGRRR